MAGLVHAVETLKNMRKFLRGNAGSGIRHLQAHLSARCIRRKDDFPTSRGIAEGITHQVIQHLHHAGVIQAELRQGLSGVHRKADLLLDSLVGKDRHHPFQQAARGKGLHV